MAPGLLLLLGVAGLLSFAIRLALERDYWHWAPVAARGITGLAAAILPRAVRDRWREEWLAEIEAATNVQAAGLVFALGLLFVAAPRLLLQHLRVQARRSGIGGSLSYAVLLFAPIHTVLSGLDFDESRVLIAGALFVVSFTMNILYSPPVRANRVGTWAAIAVGLSTWHSETMFVVAVTVVAVKAAVEVFVVVDHYIGEIFDGAGFHVAAIGRASAAFAIAAEDGFYLSLPRMLVWGLVPLVVAYGVQLRPRLPWRLLFRLSVYALLGWTVAFAVTLELLAWSPFAALATSTAVAVASFGGAWLSLSRRASLGRGLFVLGTEAARRDSRTGAATRSDEEAPQ